jgi:hypothetical protein
MTDERRPVHRRTMLKGAAAAAAGLATLGDGAADPNPGPIAGAPPERAVGRGDGFLAGVGVRAVSPLPSHLEEGVHLGGYGVYTSERGPATGVHDEIDARALAFRSGTETVALVVVDVPGIGNRLVRDIRTRVAERTGLDEPAILVEATHTHAGPDLQGLWGGVPKSYREFLVERTARAVVDAVSDLGEADLLVGTSEAGDRIYNRRGWDELHTTVNVMRVRRDDETVATLVNYSSHAVIVSSDNRLVSTDFVGPLQREVEDRFGGTAVFSPGTIGDVNPEYPEEGEFEGARVYGESLLPAVERAVDDAEPVDSGLERRSATVRFPLDNCLFKTAFEVGLLKPYYSAESVSGRAAAAVGAGETAPDAGALAVHSPVTRLRLGSGADRVEFVTVPGEATSRVAAVIRPVMGGRAQFTLGLTNNTLGYIVPTDEWGSGRHGAYEETVSTGPNAAPNYVETVQALYDEPRESPWRRKDRFGRICPGGQANLEGNVGIGAPELAARLAGRDGEPTDAL